MNPRDSDHKQAVERLRHAWRTEVEAETVYRALAERQNEARRAGILRQLADAESHHRQRIEARLAELGATPPSLDSVNCRSGGRRSAPGSTRPRVSHAASSAAS